MNRSPPRPAEEALEEKHVWQRYLGREDVSFQPSYHDNPRSDVVDRLGVVPKCVLEIGCGSGSTGKLIKERFPDATVIGVESNLQAADLARKRMDRVYGTTFEELNADEPDFPKGRIDVALLLDVLEPMYDPWRALVKLKTILAPGARVLASIPNVRNLVLMNQLAGGEWRYEAAGLLDITHIRFFTIRSMMRLFAETGYRVVTSYRLPDGRVANIPLPKEGETIDLDAGRMVLKQLSRQEVLELTATQFILLCEPA
jgi:SAM-dependent methyltransferase